MAKAKKKYTSQELIALLRNKFDNLQRYAVFEQVANGTGFKCSSWVDAVVLYLWPSDGLNRAAFEVKVSRNDFLNELQNPTKNAWAKEACNEFWFIAPKDVIKEEELPEGAGWLYPRGKTLAIARHASRSNGELTPDFVASLARSMQKARINDAEADARQFLANSREHQRVLEYEKAINEFLATHKETMWVRKPKCEDILRALSNVVDKCRKSKDVDHVRHLVEQYQSVLRELCKVMLPAAYVGLLETDAMGRYLNDRYGASSEVLTLAEHRACVDKDKGSYMLEKSKDTLQVFNMLKELVGDIKSEG